MKNLTLVLFILTFANPALSKTVLFIGDSLTEGYGVPKADSFPSLVQKKFDNQKKKIKVLNGSVSGSTTASGLSRLRWFLKAKPDILFLALGANDGLRGIKLSESKKNLIKIIDLAREKNMKIILAGMLLPPNYGEKYRTEFEVMYKDLEKKYKLTRIPFLLKGVAGEKDLNQNDGIHPNEKGHVIISNTVYKTLRSVL